MKLLKYCAFFTHRVSGLICFKRLLYEHLHQFHRITQHSWPQINIALCRGLSTSIQHFPLISVQFFLLFRSTEYGFPDALTGDVAGKVWVSAISQKVEGLSYLTTDLGDDRATAFDIGTTVNEAGFGLTAYYSDGIGQTHQLYDGFDPAGKSRDSDQWYLQATYLLPTTTKVGVSYGESTLDGNSADHFNDAEDSMWTVDAYHPITKHLNLVAEYSEAERDRDNTGSIADVKAKAKTISLVAILFF